MKSLVKNILTYSSLLLLCACSQSSLQQDTATKAFLDYENNIIVLPLDEYLENSNDSLNYRKIVDQRLKECFIQHGDTYTPDTYEVIGTRTYGLWNPEHARLYGFGSIGHQPPMNDQKMLEKCDEEIDSDGLLAHLRDLSAPSELVGRLLSESYSAARDNPAWQEAREAWWACLKDKGLTPRTGSSEWGTEEDRNLSSLSAEENIRIATIEAQCSKDTGMAQTLADLEASYQAPLVKENQDALNSIKEDLETYRQKMQDYLAQHQ